MYYYLSPAKPITHPIRWYATPLRHAEARAEFDNGETVWYSLAVMLNNYSTFAFYFWRYFYAADLLRGRIITPS